MQIMFITFKLALRYLGMPALRQATVIIPPLDLLYTLQNDSARTGF